MKKSRLTIRFVRIVSVFDFAYVNENANQSLFVSKNISDYLQSNCFDHFDHTVTFAMYCNTHLNMPINKTKHY